jgi:hypothetical protein
VQIRSNMSLKTWRRSCSNISHLRVHALGAATYMQGFGVDMGTTPLVTPPPPQPRDVHARHLMPTVHETFMFCHWNIDPSVSFLTLLTCAQPTASGKKKFTQHPPPKRKYKAVDWLAGHEIAGCTQRTVCIRQQAGASRVQGLATTASRTSCWRSGHRRSASPNSLSRHAHQQGITRSR